MSRVVEFRSLAAGRVEAVEADPMFEASFRSLALAGQWESPEWYEARGVAALTGNPVRLVCDGGSWGVVYQAEWFQARDEAHAELMFRSLVGNGGVELASSVRVAS